MNEKTFESTKLAQPAGATDSWQYLCFNKTWDAFLAQSGGESARVFRDGTKVRFGVAVGGFALINREKGLPAFFSGGKIYPAFEITGTINTNETFNPSFSFGYSQYPSGTNGAFADDIYRLYLYSEYKKVSMYSLDTGVKVGEIAHPDISYLQNIAWVQNGQVAGMSKADGKVVIMDYLSSVPQVLATGNVDPFMVGAYDCSFKLFVTIGTDYKIRIYTGEVLPNGLSAPVFDPVSISGINANKVTVRLTGTGGEPLPNWWVNWELEDVGDGIIGSLDKYGSLTDAEGYAHNLYIGPDDSTTGQCKAKASVVL